MKIHFIGHFPNGTTLLPADGGRQETKAKFKTKKRSGATSLFFMPIVNILQTKPEEVFSLNTPPVKKTSESAILYSVGVKTQSECC